MEDYDEIYKRIHERKQINSNQPKTPKIKKERKKKSSLKLLNRFLGLICLLLAFLIYAYKDTSASFVNKVLHTNISFEKINTFMTKISSSLTNFFSFGSGSKTNYNHDMTVSSNSKFVKVSDFYYTNSEKTVFSYTDGTVISINYDNKGYQVIVRHDNGYMGIYEELDTTLVKEYDRVTSSTKLGNFESEFGLYFLKNKVTYRYEDII